MAKSTSKSKAIDRSRIKAKKYIIDTSKPPPGIPALFTDLQWILSVEIDRIKNKCLTEELGNLDASKVSKYISCLCEIGKLQIQKKLQDDLRALSDEDLEEELKKMGLMENNEDGKRKKQRLKAVLSRVS